MSIDFDRRRFIEASGTAAVGVMATAAISQPGTAAPAAAVPGRSPVPYQIKPMPFDPSHIKGMSEKILISHYENNYAGAVKRLNAIDGELASLDWPAAPTFLVNGLKREQLIATNSMILHEHFFNALGGGGRPEGALADAIVHDFGSFERWSAEFAAMGKAEGGGSGWVILTYSPRDKRLVNAWAADHTTTLAAGQPVLVLDMYEHAYHMDFGAKAGSYVDAYMQIIRWDNAAKLYERYSREA
jgi:superoxide dismutase, Fe-Mn family